LADTHSIHLVRSPQVQPSKPQQLDPADIAAEALDVVRECRVALSEFEEYQVSIFGELAARLNQLEVSAIRSIAQKARRS
jgi:hypothetical protein